MLSHAHGAVAQTPAISMEPKRVVSIGLPLQNTETVCSTLPQAIQPHPDRIALFG